MRFTQQQLDAAKSVSLIDYLKSQGYALKQKGRDYCLKDHDSFIISANNKWNWFSQGFGGRNTIDFVTTIKKVPYVEAVIRLSEYAGEMNISYDRGSLKKAAPSSALKPSPLLPVRHENSHAAFAYLNQTRCIDKEIIAELMHEGLIYQGADVHISLYGGKVVQAVTEKGMERLLQKGIVQRTENNIGYKDGVPRYMTVPDFKRDTLNKMVQQKQIRGYQIYYSVVFTGTDENGEIRYASKRSTNSQSKFRQDALDSDKSVGFHVDGNGNKLFITESPIDALSIMTLGKMKGLQYRRFSYLSLGGVSDVALERYLKVNPQIKELTFCLDNDEAGLSAMERYSEKYTLMGYSVKLRAPTTKDFNDDLIMTLPPPESEMIL